eukprot:gene22209-63859_t
MRGAVPAVALVLHAVSTPRGAAGAHAPGPSSPAPGPSSHHADPVDFGAVGDGRADDTAALTAAFDSVERAGGGVVELRAGHTPPAHQRPDMVQPYMVDGLTIRDVTLRNSPAWTLHPVLCNDVVVSNIVIESGQFDDAPQYSGHNVDGVDPDSCTNVLIEDSVIRAGDDCIAIYSVHGPTRNVTVRNLTCHTPLSITHGNWGTSDVLFENCTVRGDWGNDTTYKPQWWKTALRLKSDRNTNGTIADVTYRRIRAVDVDLLFDIQMWYPCQNQSGMDNYRLCRSYYPVKAGITPHIRNVTLTDVVAERAWRAGWLNCLPESPCSGILLDGVSAAGALPMVCEHATGSVTGGDVPGGSACFAAPATARDRSRQRRRAAVANK